MPPLTQNNKLILRSGKIAMESTKGCCCLFESCCAVGKSIQITLSALDDDPSTFLCIGGECASFAGVYILSNIGGGVANCCLRGRISTLPTRCQAMGDSAVLGTISTTPGSEFVAIALAMSTTTQSLYGMRWLVTGDDAKTAVAKLCRNESASIPFYRYGYVNTFSGIPCTGFPNAGFVSPEGTCITSQPALIELV